LIDVQRETLDKLYEGVAVYGSDGRLKLYNPAFAHMWQLPVLELNSEPHARDLVGHVRDYFNVNETDWPALAERIVARATELEARTGRLERADGSVLDYAQVPLPDGACLFTYLDVTDSIRVERALRERNEALETADRLKSEFIANVSYELRTPLNAIVGFAEILENQYFGKLNRRQKEYSGAIVESSQRLMTLINDILDLASVEAGYLQLDVQAVDIQALLESVYTLGHERARNGTLSLLLDCPRDIGSLAGDERRLKQALFNLLSNAFKFTPPGGTVTLSARPADQEILLTVTDTGIGIAREDRARVFGKFERRAGQGRQPGAGLGLSLVKSFIELHGGRVDLESEPDRGTRVTCHLPKTARTQPDIARAAQDDRDGEVDNMARPVRRDGLGQGR
jgi:signal transduction histidine kinase